MFRTQNFCPGSKNVFVSRQKHFLFTQQQNLFPQHVSRAAKLGNICIRNNRKTRTPILLSWIHGVRSRLLIALLFSAYINSTIRNRSRSKNHFIHIFIAKQTERIQLLTNLTELLKLGKHFRDVCCSEIVRLKENQRMP